MLTEDLSYGVSSVADVAWKPGSSDLTLWEKTGRLKRRRGSYDLYRPLLASRITQNIYVERERSSEHTYMGE